jgi:glycosyltransferase involved in cell wall biosynthesis
VQKTIFVNGRFLTQPSAGVQRYSLELLNHFDCLLADEAYAGIKMICLVPPGDSNTPGWKNIELRKVGINKANLWEQIDLAIYAGGQLLFSPANTGPFYYANQVITIHDASVFRGLGTYKPLFRAKHIALFWMLGRIAKLVLTDSHFSQQELAHFLLIPINRLRVILLGGDHLNEAVADISILQKNYLLKNSYFLSVATQARHKNLARISQAEAVAEADIELVMVGARYEKLFHQGENQSLSAWVHLLGHVSDNELKALYENALALIFPSLYEGFGLPVLEAMHSGCPVLCSNAASLPEVGGSAALYFDPLNAIEMNTVIKKFLADPALQTDLRRRGLLQAARFTWELTARATLNALAECL